MGKGVAQSGRAGDLTAAVTTDSKLRSGASKGRAASKKRSAPVVEDDEDDDAGDDDESAAPVTRRSSSSGSKKTSSSGSSKKAAAKPAPKSASAGAGDWNAIARVPPKPASNPRSVTFPDGKTVQVYPHSDHTTGSGDWWCVRTYNQALALCCCACSARLH